MKTTIEIPDVLYRDVKAEAARRGITVREATTALYEAWVAGYDPKAAGAVDAAALNAWIAKLELIAGRAGSSPSFSSADEVRRDRNASG
jgi:hypothetical protein